MTHFLKKKSPRQKKYLKIGTLVILIAIVTYLHYSTSTALPYWHEVFKTLYFIPIILTAFWFDLLGALITSLSISLIYLPHVIFQWGGNLSYNSSRALIILLYNVGAFVTGYLAQLEKKERQRYQEAARELDQSYGKLKEQSDQLRLIEEKLRQTERLSTLGELTASLAHEVRNPLGSIKGVAEILADEYAESGKNREFVEILQKEVARLDEVVANYLNFARTNRVQMKPVDLSEVLQSTLALLRVKMGRAEIKTEVQVPTKPIEILGDEHLLREALLNLILNAIAAMPHGGTLRIRFETNKNSVLLFLRDSGVGIPESKMKEIFRPFFTTRKSGTGLGLPISKRIIEKHGGTLQIESREGEGTEVKISLPAKEVNRKNSGKHDGQNSSH